MAVHQALQYISLTGIEKFGQLGLMVLSCIRNPFPGLVHKLPFIRVEVAVNFILHVISRTPGPQWNEARLPQTGARQSQ